MRKESESEEDEEDYSSEQGEEDQEDSSGEESEEEDESDEEEVDESYGQADEGNAFSGALAKAKKDGIQKGETMKVGGKTYPVKEDDMEEGNKFTGNLAKARASGAKEADLDGDGDMEKVHEGDHPNMTDNDDPNARSNEPRTWPKGTARPGRYNTDTKQVTSWDHRTDSEREKDWDSMIEEGDETCNECGMYESQCCCDHESVDEGFANDAGGDAMADTELMKLKALLSMGTDLHKMKRNQTTRDPVQVNVAEALSDWKKLSGIK
jgi:hypothetical protein